MSAASAHVDVLMAAPCERERCGRGDGAQGAGDASAGVDVLVAARSGIRRLADRVADRLRLERGQVERLFQWVRYGATSCVATLTSLTVLGALVATNTLSPGWANVVATSVGTVPSFELNRRWVWGRTGRRSLAGEVGPFCVMSFAGLALSTLLVSTAGQWATGAGLDAFWRTAAIEVANVAAFGTLWIAQFVVLDRVLFAGRARGATLRAAKVPASRVDASAVSPTIAADVATTHGVEAA